MVRQNITYDPNEKNNQVPVDEWLKYMGKTKHLLNPKYENEKAELVNEIDRRWKRLKAMNDNPIL